MDNSGHVFTFSGNRAGGHARQHNGNVHGNVINNYGNAGPTAQAASVPERGFDSTRAADYTVGWICALPVPEWQASRLLFDEEYEREPTLPNATYQYVFGRINGHNVVMGCLPDSQMGVTAAAHVANEMQLLFQSLRFALLVGVGGGVWSETHDVRLGDVVVSRPDSVKRTGGVIQYDFGKANQGGIFQETSSLNMPPQVLMAAVGKLRSALPTRNKFSEYLKAFEDFKEELPEYAAMPEASDMLFEADYQHPPSNPTCKRCDPQHEVHRPIRLARKSKIHYGTIASGNQVMKDAAKRDFIAQQHDILCFEMEAAGLVNYFPCLVIRGICDYCDSHKNKAWQPYAAAAAAAYAKELLRNVAPQEVKKQAPLAQLEVDATPMTFNTLPYDCDHHFVGRKTIIEDIIARLFITGKHTRLALAGIGGVGKSQIAIEYAYRLKEAQPDVHIFWVHASTFQRCANDYKNLATTLHLHGADDPKADHLQLVTTWLTGQKSGRWLLILDNADDEHVLKSLPGTAQNSAETIGPYLPQKRDCAILMTTRNERAGMTLVGNNLDDVIRIEPFAPEDGMQLIQNKLTGDKACSVKEARQLAARLDCIPLAITQAIAHIGRRRLFSVSAYLDRLETSEEDMLSGDYSDLQRTLNEVPNSVLHTWAFSLQQIASEQLCAAQLLLTICWFDKDTIPLWLLRHYCRSADDDLEILLGFSLLSLDVSMESVHMHRLVQICSRSWATSPNWCGSDRPDCWQLAALRVLANAYPNGQEFESWPFCEALDAHVTALLSVAFYDLTWNCRDDRALLMGRLAQYREVQGRDQDAIFLQEFVVQELNQIFGPDNEQTMTVTSNLAGYYRISGKYQQAMKLGRLVLDQRIKILGPEHNDTLESKNLLVLICNDLDQIDEAAILCNEVLQTRREKYGARHLDTLNSMNQMMLVREAQRRYTEAKDIANKIHSARRETLGPIHPQTLSAMSNLAVQSINVRKYPEAEKLITTSIILSINVLGHDHVQTIERIDLLHNILVRQARIEEAYLLSTAILHAREKRLGPRHPKTLKTLADRAWSSQRKGLLDEAIGARREALAHFQDLYSSKHSRSRLEMRLLADVLLQVGRPQEALRHAENATNCLVPCHIVEQALCQHAIATAKRALGLGAKAFEIRNWALRNLASQSTSPHQPLAIRGLGLRPPSNESNIDMTRDLAAEAFAAHRITNDRQQRSMCLYQKGFMELIRPSRPYRRSLDIDPSEQQEPGNPSKERLWPRRRWSVACGPMRPLEFGDPPPERDYRKIKEEYQPEIIKQQAKIIAIAESWSSA